MDNEKLFASQSTNDIRFEKPTFIDPLTGLFNRYYFYEFFPQEIKKSLASNYSLGIFILDIDNFKHFNDTYGHLFGDDVLKQFSDFLKKTRRQTDIVIRYAGDEFMVLLPGVDRKSGMMVGKRLVEEIAKFAFSGKDKEEMHLTISLGFSLCPQDAVDMDKLIDLADKALYLSKEKGRNCISSADEVTLETASYKIALDYFPCPKFVDRHEEMTKFKSAFSDIVMGRNELCAAFIISESGIGRTRLLNEFNDYLKDKAVLISAKGSFKRQQEPYYLFAQAIDSYISKLGTNSLKIKELFSALPAEELAELFKLLPQISKAPVSVHAGKEARSLLFKALLELMTFMAKDSPLLISFDDVQWGDRASLELLNYLIKYEKKRKIFIALTFEEKPLPQESVIKKLLDYMGEGENTMQLKLSILSQRDTYEMIEGMFPGLKRLKELNELVFNITKGNPAFIEEIFKSLAENRLLSYHDNSWSLSKELEELNIPASLEETVRKRLKKLDKETKELIVQAAVIGDDFSVGLLNKMGEKNESYVFDMISRAQKMHIVKETEKKGSFNFVNHNVHDALYGELNEAERNALHQKIGQIIQEEHKDDLNAAAADLSYHFNNAAKGALSAKYSGLVSERAGALFNPAEIVDYLKELSQEAAEVEGEEVKHDFSLSCAAQINRLIRLIQSVMKNFQLYPKSSSIRGNSINDMLKSLDIIFKELPRIKIIETEGTLVVNGRRFSLREAKEIGGDELASLMVEADISSVSILRGVTAEEIDIFMENLGCGRAAILAHGGWKAIVAQEKFKYILIDEFRLGQIAKPKAAKPMGFKKFEDAMMMEFLLGKLDGGNIDSKDVVSKISQEPQKFAQAINKMAEEAIKEGKTSEALKTVTESIKKINSQISSQNSGEINAVEELSKVILELDWKLKNKLIRSKPQMFGVNDQEVSDNFVSNLNDKEIVNLIEESFVHGLDNLLALKDLIDKAVPDRAKREKVMPKIEEKLSSLGMDKEAINCVIGKTPWEEMSLDKKLDIFINLPQEEFALLDAGLIGDFLEELLKKDKGGAIKKILRNLMAKAPSTEPQIHQKIEGIITNFIRKDTAIAERIYPLLEILKSETNRTAYIDALNTVKAILKELFDILNPEKLYAEMQKPALRVYRVILCEVFDALWLRVNSQDSSDAAIKEYIKNFITDESGLPNFTQVLALALLIHFPADYQRIKEILMLFGENSADALLGICLNNKELSEDSFEAYVFKRKISDVLKNMADTALYKLQQNIAKDLSRQEMFILLELAANLGDGRILEALTPLLHHNDPELRKQAIITLGAIGTNDAGKILSDLAQSERNKQIQALIKKIMLRFH